MYINSILANFTQVPNEILKDKTMNYKQIAVFTYLVSKPSGWHFSSKRICDDIGMSYKLCLLVLKDFERMGYLTRKKIADGYMLYNLHTPSTKTASNLQIQNTQGAMYKNDTVSKRHCIKSTPVSNKEKAVKKNINSKKEIEAKKTVLLACSEKLFKKLEVIITEMMEFGFDWSVQTLIEKVQMNCNELTIDQSVESVIFYWNEVQKKRCISDSFHENGFWISKKLIPNAGYYYLKRQLEIEEEERIKLDKKSEMEAESVELADELDAEEKVFEKFQSFSTSEKLKWIKNFNDVYDMDIAQVDLENDKIIPLVKPHNLFTFKSFLYSNLSSNIQVGGNN